MVIMITMRYTVKNVVRNCDDNVQNMDNKLSKRASKIDN